MVVSVNFDFRLYTFVRQSEGFSKKSQINMLYSSFERGFSLCIYVSKFICF